MPGSPSDRRPDGARWGYPADDQLIVTMLVVGFVLLRAFTVRSTPVIWFDSGGFEELSLIGRAPRLPTVPLLYWLLPSDFMRIVAQAVISGVCFVALALVAGRQMADRRVRIGTVVTFLALGLTPQITNWDSALLSDSVTLSLTAALIAAWLAVRARPTPLAIGAVLGLTVLWTFTRELHVYVTAGVALLAVVATVRRRASPWPVLAAGLSVIAVLSYAVDAQNTDTITDNVGNIVGGRVLIDPEIREWFEDRGMPVMQQFETGEGLMGVDVRKDPDFEAWARENGMSLWIKFLLTHPSYALEGPYGELLEDRNTFAEDLPNSVMLSPEEGYGRTRPVLPDVVEDVLFAPGRTGSLLLLTAAAVVLTAVADGRHGRDRRRLVPVVIVLLVFPYIFVSYNGSTLEHGRHAMPAALAFRIGILLLLATALDQLLARAGSVDVGGEGVAGVGAEVDDSVGEGDGDAGVGDGDGEPVADLSEP